MGGLLALLLLLLAGSSHADDRNKVLKTTLVDQPRLSCYLSGYRRMPADCTNNQLVCYYTRRMPRFSSDFRPNDLIGRGCDVQRNAERDSCQEYSKGLDMFVRCECATTDCNSHYWHGFATAALHHRKDLNETRNAAKKTFGGVAEDERYSKWFMNCINVYLLLQVYYLLEYLVKCYRFQKRAIRMRCVLVARGTQQQETLMWNLPETKPEVTIHNFRTSFVKFIDGFIRYRSLGSLPPVDVNQLRANWVLGKQDLHRHPKWFRQLYIENEKLEKQGTFYNNEMIDLGRAGLERFFFDQTIADEMELVKREKEADRKKRKTTVVVSTSEKDNKRSSQKDESESSSKRTTQGATELPHNFIL